MQYEERLITFQPNLKMAFVDNWGIFQLNQGWTVYFIGDDIKKKL